MLAILWRDFRSLFASPLAWTLLAIIQFLLAWTFLLQIDQYLALQSQLLAIESAPGASDLIVAPALSTGAIVLLLLMPLLSMHLIAGERRNGTLALLRSAPISTIDIVLGKFGGLMLFVMIVILLQAVMLLSLNLGTTLDNGKVVAGMLGFTLLSAAFASLGLFMSALARQPLVAAVLSFGALLLLMLLDAGGGGDDIASMLSLLDHYRNLLQGRFGTSDIAYYLVFTATFLLLSMVKLEAERLHQ